MIQDLPAEEFKDLLHQTTQLIQHLYTDIDQKAVYHSREYEEIAPHFQDQLPIHSSSIESVINDIQEFVIPNTTIHYSQHFYAWIASCPSQASLLAEMIAMAMNVNSTTWMNGAASSEVEQQVVKWISQFIGYAATANGVLLSGGSMANLIALKTCLNIKADYNIDEEGIQMKKPFVVYVSDQNHFSIDRAIRALGIGSKHLRKIQTLSDYTIDPQALEDQIKLDIKSNFTPLCIIGNAGSVNTGSVDDLVALHEIARAYDLWLHLDGAYGGFAAATSSGKKLFRGLELADSLSVDAHKWLFVPFECSCLLLKDPKHLKQTFSYVPDYQKFAIDERKVDFSEHSLQQSRNFKALKVWMNFKAYGAEKLAGSINHSIELVHAFVEQLKKAKNIELMHQPSLAIICFRYIPEGGIKTEEALNKINEAIVDKMIQRGKVFTKESKLKGKTVIRASCTNFRRQNHHFDALLKEVQEVGEIISKEYAV